MKIWLWVPPALLAFCLACVLIPYTGLEGDECVFAMAAFGGLPREFLISIFHHQFPLMVYYYAGSLKALLLWPVLHLFGANVWSLRLPVAVMGAATVALTFDFAKRIANWKVALIAALLTASDPVFILSNTFDWGPVAMEHLLLMTILALVVRGRLQAACFLAGLALWNKGVFVWALGGLIVGGVCAYWPVIRRHVPGPRVLVRCAALFLLGTAPLLLYNIRRPAQSLRFNVRMGFEGFGIKLISLHYTLDGSILFGIVTGMDGVTDHTGPRFHDLLLPALILSIIVTIWRFRDPELKPAVFAMMFCAGSFFLIAATKFTGTAHHLVLMYPMVQLLVATVIASADRLKPAMLRYLTPAVTIAMVAANLLVFNSYITQFRRSGPFGLFSDALFPMIQSLHEGVDHVYVLDVGLWENTFTLHEGRLSVRPLFVLVLPVSDTQSALRDPRAVFVDHVPGHQYLAGAAARLDGIGQSLGLHKVPVATFYDSKGRPQMEKFLYR